jgi:hypothetical protein
MDQQSSIQAGEDILELATDPMWKARKDIRRYDKAASLCKILHYFLLGSIVLFSIITIVIILITHIPKDVPLMITVLVLLAMGAVGLLKPNQRSVIYHATAEAIARELTDCIYEQGLYKGTDTLSLLKEQLTWLERSTSGQLARLNIFGTTAKEARWDQQRAEHQCAEDKKEDDRA